jgi:hypothetical protein
VTSSLQAHCREKGATRPSVHACCSLAADVKAGKETIVLQSLDVLIGLIVVILALSMAVTVVTQSITAIVNSRGRHLKRGLQDLLQQLDPALTATISAAVATKVLTHPLVSGSSTPLAGEGRTMAWLRQLVGGPRYGNVIHREEFTKLLMALASGEGSNTLDATDRQVLLQALGRNGVADPAGTLAAVRGFAMELEKTSPALTHTARQNLAFLHAGPSDLVAKINSWFDQTMDRTSQRFTASTRAITFAGAFVVAFGLQVDTPSLANRLAMDDTLRDAFVRQAQVMNASQPASAPAAPAAPAQKIEADYRAFLADNGILRLPSHHDYWTGFNSLSAVFGMLVTALLLSLGAPVWYGALARLLQLRSVLAFKEDKQRSERQATAAPAALDASSR